YRQIGGGSPLRLLTEDQARALAEEFKRRGKDVETFVGMVTWRPFLAEAMNRIAKTNLENLVILPLFPQYSVTTTGAGFSGLGRKNPDQLSYQRKIGPVKWLEPFTNDAIIGLGREGVDDVLVVPISFVSEHIETLYELDILFKKVAAGAGVENFRRVPALNS